MLNTKHRDVAIAANGLKTGVSRGREEDGWCFERPRPLVTGIKINGRLRLTSGMSQPQCHSVDLQSKPIGERICGAPLRT